MFIVLVAVVFIVSPAMLAQNGLTPIQELGKTIFFDHISSPDRMACATCHGPAVGFTGPVAGINKHGAVYRGAVPKRFGNRKPPSAGYATLSPLFDYDVSENLFFGGNFWDGRATGWNLGNPAADQALGPFLNPVEQNNPDKKAVLKQIAKSKYSYLWEIVWGEPISYDTPAEIELNYDRVGLSIAEYEASTEVNQFTSKYDYYLAGEVSLTQQEMEGLDLFEGQAMCANCHIPPLFTDFTFDNLGVPKNPENPFYDMDKVYLDNGDPINPLGDEWIDKGLGDFLRNLADPANQGWRSLPDVTLALYAMSNQELLVQAAANDGKQKVPTLRNVDKRNGNNFPKAYAHNGYFKSLEEIVHFYNTRDVESWPPPEVPQNVNTEELGNLGLNADQEAALVAFMKTLSDGYDPSHSMAMLEPKSAAQALQVVGPNPFNPETNFLYTVSAPGNVRIEVFNITGQRIATLVNDWKPAGDYPLRWNAAQFPSGIYFIRLSTNREVAVKKVSLIK